MPTARNRTITIICAAHTRTGGPEALHQLGRALVDFGHEVRMVYVAPDVVASRTNKVVSFPHLDAPMPDAYAHYALAHTFEVADEPSNIVVIPELWPHLGRNFAHAAVYLWWLSIDNGLRAVASFGGFDAIRAARWTHLCQSYYAIDYLAQRDITGLPLFDYTSPEHDAVVVADDGPRIDRVLYPSKGRWFTGWLRRWAPDLDWLEISGFTQDQVRELFLTSKLYVDFGSHPGKDRMPREAAKLGCCVITGQRGAAGNPFDIPIPLRYKFRDSRINVPRIIRAIRQTLAEFETRRDDFSAYRQAITGERLEFVAQTARIFGGRLIPAQD